MNKQLRRRPLEGRPQWRRVLSAVVLGAILAGCAPQDSAPQVFTERRTTEALAANTELGGDCTEHGNTACRSGLCLHTAASRGSGYICSQACTNEAQCPRTWSCEQMLPGQDVCVPPAPRARAGAR